MITYDVIAMRIAPSADAISTALYVGDDVDVDEDIVTSVT